MALRLVAFGAAVRFAPPTPLKKELPKFGPNAIPGVFLGWNLHPGGRWTGEYLVAYWPDFQDMGLIQACPCRISLR